jgi:choice-of-anchor A domain-containing protein
VQFSFSSFRRALPVFTLGSLLTFAASTAAATGLVDGFNVTIFNNFKSQFTDLQGTLAVGKNLSLTGYALNQSAPNPNTAAGGFDTVVGGSMLFQNGTIYGKVSASSASISGASVCAGCLTIGSAPIDFGQLESTVKNQSSFLYTLSSTGTVTQPYSTLTLTGSGTAFEVFTLSSAQLNGNSGIAVTGVAANATILINVTDTASHTATTSGGGFSINGQQLQNAQNVVFNFASSITTISIANSFYSSMLAPSADVIGSYGAFNGDLVASSYSGSNQFNLDPFTGNIPTPPVATPEPATLGLFAIATLLMVAGAFRRNCRDQKRTSQLTVIESQ